MVYNSAKLIIKTTYVLMHKNIKFLAPLVSTIIARAVAQVVYNSFYRNNFAQSNKLNYTNFSEFNFAKYNVAKTFCDAISTASVMHHYSHLRFYNSTSALNNSAHLAFFRGICVPIANDLGRKLGDLFNGPVEPEYKFLKLESFLYEASLFSFLQFCKYDLIQNLNNHFFAGCFKKAIGDLHLGSTISDTTINSIYEGISLSFYSKTKDAFQNLAFSVMGTAGDSTNLLAKFLQTSAIECTTAYLSPSRGGNHLASIEEDIRQLFDKIDNLGCTIRNSLGI